MHETAKDSPDDKPAIFARAEDAALTVGAVCLFVIMVTVTADALFRYLFHAPISFAYEFVSQYLMVAAFFLALAGTFRIGGHITVDFFSSMMPSRWRRACAAIGDVLMLPVLVIGAYTGARSSIAAWERAEVVMAGGILWPVWVSWALVPIGMSLLVVRVLLHLRDLWRGTDIDTLRAGERDATTEDGI